MASVKEKAAKAEHRWTWTLHALDGKSVGAVMVVLQVALGVEVMVVALRGLGVIAPAVAVG